MTIADNFKKLVSIYHQGNAWGRGDLFLTWEDGSKTVRDVKLWTEKEYIFLRKCQESGTPIYKRGELLGPALTKEEFEQDHLEAFGFLPETGLYEAMCNSTRDEPK
nr:hypothetical protein 21 [Balneolaceae bacterium]